MQILKLRLKIEPHLLNDEHIDTAETLDIIIPMFILIEYCDDYSGTSESLWQFKRQTKYE